MSAVSLVRPLLAAGSSFTWLSRLAQQPRPQKGFLDMGRQPGAENLSSRYHCCWPRATSLLRLAFSRMSLWLVCGRGAVHRQCPGLRDTQADFSGFAWGPGGAAAMFRGYPCFLASSCTRWMAFLIPWQGIRNAVVPHLSHPGKLHSLYVPPGAVFLPGCFQHQWLSNPEKGASPVCPQTHIPDVTPQSLTIRPVDQRAQNNLEEVPWKDSQLIISLPQLSAATLQPRLLPSVPQKGGSRRDLASLSNGSLVCKTHKLGTVQPGFHSAFLSVHRCISGQRRRGPQSTQLLKLLLLQNRNPPQNTQSSHCGE